VRAPQNWGFYHEILYGSGTNEDVIFRICGEADARKLLTHFLGWGLTLGDRDAVGNGNGIRFICVVLGSVLLGCGSYSHKIPIVP